MELLYQRAYRVASHTAGPSGLVRPASLLGFLEDAAGEHASEWRLSFGDLLPRGLMWVLTRHHLRLLRTPRYGEEITVITWPSGRREKVATRDFEVKDATGEILALATTAWAVLDTRSRRPHAIDDVVPPGFVLDRRAITDDFNPLPEVQDAERVLPLPVMQRDLDMNRHVNHTVYLQWALEALPPEWLEALALQSIEMAFLAEAGPGDTITTGFAELWQDAGARALAHCITHSVSGRVLARLRTTWTE